MLKAILKLVDRLQLILSLYLLVSGVFLLASPTYALYGLYMIVFSIIIWARDMPIFWYLVYSIPMFFYISDRFTQVYRHVEPITSLTATLALGVLFVLWLDDLTEQ